MAFLRPIMHSATRQGIQKAANRVAVDGAMAGAFIDMNVFKKQKLTGDELRSAHLAMGLIQHHMDDIIDNKDEFNNQVTKLREQWHKHQSSSFVG